MKKSSQNQPADATAPAVPEQVSVAMAEIAEDMQEGLLALAVGAGLQVMQAMMEADVTDLAGARGKHDRERTAVRHGRERGSVTLGGRRVPVSRPRVRAVDGSGELAIASYELFSSTEILGKMAMEKMLAGLSTRRYPVGLEPVGERVGETVFGDKQVGGLAQVCGDDRNRAGGAAFAGSVRAGSGGADDRRGALRRVLLCRRVGH